MLYEALLKLFGKLCARSVRIKLLIVKKERCKAVKALLKGVILIPKRADFVAFIITLFLFYFGSLILFQHQSLPLKCSPTERTYYLL